ncbi:MAG TPA: hypothetical protein EYG39_10000, partial [Rhodothermales bacterium]|nr:hypothetical protein [Rhodothermales bacterium]
AASLYEVCSILYIAGDAISGTVVTAGIAAEAFTEAAGQQAVETVRAVSHDFRIVVRALMGVSATCALSYLWLRCPSAGERAAAQRGPGAPGSIAGDGPSSRAIVRSSAPGGARRFQIGTPPAPGLPALPDSSVEWFRLKSEISEGAVFEACRGAGAKATRLVAAGAVALSLAAEGADALVRSSRGTGPAAAAYPVRLFSGRLLDAICSCEDYLKNGPLCKHGAAALLQLLGSASPASSPERRIALAGSRAAPPPQLCIKDRPSCLPPSGSRSGGGGGGVGPLPVALQALHAAELEIAGLKAALEAARLKEEAHRTARKAPADALGWVVAVSGSSGTLVDWLRALSACGRYAFVMAFTFDHPPVVDAIIRARSRGVDARVLLDKTQAVNDLSKNLIPVAKRLTRLGVKVRLLLGERQHAKVLITDKELVLGSANWTYASPDGLHRGKRNVECGAALRLFEAEHNTQQSLFWRHWDAGRDWDAGERDTTLACGASPASP